ncbi:hypothetical protein PybrP1_004628 [[Pythium] brassicae (nom. inval.)]|nr:hypothetical protein PybrP1_004628 [[Pythium] brassicae (nom. inval.)]
MAKAPLLAWVVANQPRVRVREELVDVVACTSTAETSGDAAADRSIVARDAIPAAQTLITLSSGAFVAGGAWLHGLETLQRKESEAGAVRFSAAELQELRGELQRLQLSPTLQLVLALLHERARRQQSRFDGYIAQLPAHVSLPMNWSVHGRRQLKRTAALFERFAVPLARRFPALWPADETTLTDFQWAYAVVSSRAFTISGASEPALLPVIDMANHASENPAATIVRADDGSFQLVTLRAVAKGEAVTISYGDLSNAELLCRYGFVLPEPVPSDCMLVSSTELLATYTAFLNDDVDNLTEVASEDESNDDDGGAGGSQEHPQQQRDQVVDVQREPPAKKRRVFAEKKREAADSLFFQLTGNPTQQFGLGDALLSFVFARHLPAEALYDVLGVLLRRRDKVYSAALERREQTEAVAKQQSQSDAAIAAAHETALALLLTKHERAVCRRILLGLVTLAENSSGDEDDDDDDGDDPDTDDVVDGEEEDDE